MSNIPIIILNKDRLTTLKMLVSILNKRNYTNIFVIDNKSTYEPLLQWYKDNESNVKVYVNVNLPNTIDVLYKLVSGGDPFFTELISNYYVFTDSDTVPIDEIPENFIETMIEICKKYNKHKIGLGCKLDDLDLSIPVVKHAYDYESTYFSNGFIDNEIELFPHPIDTTFALYSPNSNPSWGCNVLRMGHPYMMRHMPFYYFGNNLPEDEKYYLQHLQSKSGERDISGACWSPKMKAALEL